jgi:hypothetical protein
MAGELPSVPSDYLANRLEQLEQRLERARQARVIYSLLLEEFISFRTITSSSSNKTNLPGTFK